MRTIVFKLFLTIILSLYVQTKAQISAKVIGIKDGDTIIVLLSDNSQKTLRLAEVDCPENRQPFGKNAKLFTSEQVFGKLIEYIETDVDRYGRTIAKIYYDSDKYLSRELIKVGLGWWYHQYSKDIQLGKLQNEAKKQGIGLWREKGAISPAEWRKLKK